MMLLFEIWNKDESKKAIIKYENSFICVKVLKYITVLTILKN